MKRLFFSLIFLTVCSIGVKAQYDTEIDLGIRLKHTIVRFTDLDPQEIRDQGGKFNSSSWAIGGFLQMRVNHFYFQPELVYNRTTTVLGNEFGNTVADYSFGEYDLVFHQAELPLLVGYRTGFEDNAIRIGAGPVLNYIMSIDSETRLTRRSDNGLDIQPYPFSDEAFNKLSIGWRVGIGGDIGPFLVDLKYERSFTKINEELQRTTPFNFGRDYSIVFAVGYKLIRNKL